jgi:hypothetical protein
MMEPQGLQDLGEIGDGTVQPVIKETWDRKVQRVPKEQEELMVLKETGVIKGPVVRTVQMEQMVMQEQREIMVSMGTQALLEPREALEHVVTLVERVTKEQVDSQEGGETKDKLDSPE